MLTMANFICIFGKERLGAKFYQMETCYIIMDILGRIVKEISLAEEKEILINANGLLPGLYMVKVSNGPTAKMMVK